MEMWRDILIAGFTGLVSGFLVAVPVGPINVTIMNEGARRGFKWASMIGLGATFMEVIYCAIAFAGFAPFFENKVVKSAVLLISFLLMLYLGLKFLLASSIPDRTKSAERFERRWHPRSAFWVGFSRVLLNPNVLLGWITLSATFLAHDWVDTSGHERLSCVIGVGFGAGLWFFLLSHAVSRRHREISAASLLRMEHYSGIFLLTVALCMGINIIYQLAVRR